VGKARKSLLFLKKKKQKDFCPFGYVAQFIWLGLPVLACLLTGCTLVDALRPTPPQLPLDAVIPANASFTMRDGTVLPARQWLPPPGTTWQGVILALHGFTDSRDGWELPAPAFAAAGYAVFAPDQRGFGATASRGHWAGTDRMVNDAAELLAQLRARYPGQRLILMGESMGGAIATVLAARPGNAADATVLLAPAVWGWHQMDPAVATSLVVADAVAPSWAPDPGQVGKDIAASDNYAALLRLSKDPLSLRRPSIAMLRGLVDLMADAQAASAHLHGQILILSGRRDQLVPPAAAAAAWAKLAPGIRRAFYPNGYHLLLRDRDRALVIADILSWLQNPDAWLPSAADVAAGAWVADQAWQGRTPGWTPAAHADDTGADKVWPY
jgi:alpha-beta hydrolase superfamily lysophospholipase